VRDKTVKPGDHFRKSDAVYPSVWVVTRVIHAPGVPTHFTLADVEGRGEVRTISEPTLTDPEYYQPVAPKADPHPTDLDGGGTVDGHRDTPERDRVRVDRHAGGEARGWLEGMDGLGAQPAGPGRMR